MKNKPLWVRCMIASATTFALALPLAATAATDWFLKIDGIKGESQAQGHKDEIDILAWSWGLSRGTGAADRGGKGPGACVSEMAFSKYLDAATPLLMANVASGMTIPKARLGVRKTGGDGTTQEFFVVEMVSVVISSVAESGSPGDLPLESISLRFGSAKVIYKTQKADGTLGTPIETTLKGGGC